MGVETVIKKDFVKCVAASLLGDGTIEKQKYGNARFSLKQKIDHRDYVDYIANYLESLTSVSYYTTEPKQYEIRNKLCNISASVTVRTKAHPVYTQMYERAYLNRIKRIDPHYLTFIDAEYLAIWFMEDGYSMYPADSVNPNPLIVLCTDAFTYGDLIMARRAIIEKTGFIFNVNKRSKNKNGELTYRMHLSRKQSQQFLEFVRPYIVPSFEYKLKDRTSRYANSV